MYQIHKHRLAHPKSADPHPLFIQSQRKEDLQPFPNYRGRGRSTNGTIAAVTRVGKLYKVVEQRGLKDAACVR